MKSLHLVQKVLVILQLKINQHIVSAGVGTKKDETKTFKWFQESAIGGYVSEQFNLRVYYNFGIRTETDKEQAKLWYEIAAEGGYAGVKDYIT